MWSYLPLEPTSAFICSVYVGPEWIAMDGCLCCHADPHVVTLYVSIPLNGMVWNDRSNGGFRPVAILHHVCV